MAIEKILTHKNGVAEYIITSVEDLKELIDVEVGSRARLLSPVEVRDYIYRGEWVEVEKEDSYDDNEIEGIIDDINGEIMNNAVESVNEYHKNLDSLVDCTVTEFEGRDIMINPSIEGKTKSIVIKGETYQNLFNNFSISNEDSKYITVNGNTIKWTKSEVTTSNTDIKYHNSLAQLNRTYTLIFYIYKNTLQREGLEGSYSVAKFNIVSYNSGVYHIPINKTGLVKVKLIQPTTIPSDGKPYLEVFKDSVGEFEISYPILLEGDCTNDGNIPNQFEGIVGVGDKSKNLFNPKEAVHEYVDSTGNFFSSNNNVRTNYILIKPNTPYIGKSLAGSTLNNYSWFDKNKTFIKRDAVEGYAISPNNAMYLIYHNKHGEMGFTVDLSSVKIQLEEGTVSTPYEPYYNGHKIEILSNGKNILNQKDIIYGKFIEANGGTEQSNKLGCATKYMRINVNSNYNISGLYNQCYSMVAYYDTNHNYIGRTSAGANSSLKLSKTNGSSGGRNYKGNILPINTCYIRITHYKNDTVNPNVTLDMIKDNTKQMQLEESPIATEYQPYQEDKIQILLDEPLMKLPNGVCDTLEQRDDGVYLVKRVGKTILDGNTGGGLMNGLITNENYSIFRLYPKDFTFVSKEAGLISDKFSYYKFDGGFRRDSIGEAISDGGDYRMLHLRILNSRLSTVDSDGLKSWLSENPITVYYGLVTPIETKLDIPTANVTTFKDVTHISTTNETKPIINVTLDTTNISKDANQYFSIENNKNFILPNMDDIENNSIKELNLYIDIKGEYTLTFPSDIKWSSNVINLNKADYMSILLKYIKVNDVGLWLGNIRGIDKEG